jgi:sulfite dehydrogenase (quinone) subunit SoeC
MHPAKSIIAFTTLSGLGFGLLAWLGSGLADFSGWVGFTFHAIGLLLASAGLLFSTFHLGHPERALRAFTQWRSSWLSREAWAAASALSLMSLHALSVLNGTPVQALGLAGAALSLATVFTTSMIYAQLKTVPRWHSWATPALFMALALGGGALLAAQTTAAAPLLAAAAALQLIWWMQGDRAFRQSDTTLATATRLTPGTVRAFEPPHTGTNYLMQEMVFRVGRRHARRLRVLALALGYGLPLALLILPMGHMAALIAVLSHIAGIFASRWLFFAEAEHVVGLYYGRPQ